MKSNAWRSFRVVPNRRPNLLASFKQLQRDFFLSSSSSASPVFLWRCHYSSSTAKQPTKPAGESSPTSSTSSTTTTKARHRRLEVPQQQADDTAHDPTRRSLSPLERSRSMVALRISGTLSTMGLYLQPQEGQVSPLYGSLMPYVLDEKGSPHFALPESDQHAQNLLTYTKASLVVYPLVPEFINPSNFALPRVLLSGETSAQHDESKAATLRARFLQKHPGSRKYLDQLQFYSMVPSEIVYCSGGLAETIHLDTEEWTKSPICPVLSSSRKILEEMNGRKRLALQWFCKEYANMTPDEAFMFSVDRFGFELMAWRQTDRQWMELRFPFPHEMKTAEECMSGLEQAIKVMKDKHLPADLEEEDRQKLEEDMGIQGDVFPSSQGGNISNAFEKVQQEAEQQERLRREQIRAKLEEGL